MGISSVPNSAARCRLKGLEWDRSWVTITPEPQLLARETSRLKFTAIRAPFEGSINPKRSLENGDVTRTAAARSVASVFAIPADACVFSILDCLRGLYVAAQDPGLDHVAGLHVLATVGSDHHDGLA